MIEARYINSPLILSSARNMGIIAARVKMQFIRPKNKVSSSLCPPSLERIFCISALVKLPAKKKSHIPLLRQVSRSRHPHADAVCFRHFIIAE